MTSGIHCTRHLFGIDSLHMLRWQYSLRLNSTHMHDYMQARPKHTSSKHTSSTKAAARPELSVSKCLGAASSPHARVTRHRDSSTTAKVMMRVKSLLIRRASSRFGPRTLISDRRRRPRCWSVGSVDMIKLYAFQLRCRCGILSLGFGLRYVGVAFALLRADKLDLRYHGRQYDRDFDAGRGSFC